MSDDQETESHVSEDRAKYNHTTKELDRLGEVLIEADEIRSDSKLLALVEERLNDRSKRIDSITKLREKMENAEDE